MEHLPITDPLASASVLALLEDREGDLWAGTEVGGLHILRDQRFRTVSTRNGLSSDNTTTVVEDGAGVLWVGTAGDGLNALLPRAREGSSGSDTAERGGVKTYTVRNGLPSDVILSLAAAPDGDLWAGTPDGLSRIRRGAVTSFTSADGLPDDFIRSLLADADGSLWIGTRRGLTHWKDPGERHDSAARMETFTQANGLGSELVGAMTRDATGDLWVATFAGLSRLRGGKMVNYTTADGLSSNVITALLERANGALLIGTQDHGWNLWDGHGFSRVATGGLDHTSIHAILDDRLGHLWFATGAGIARCDCGESAMVMHGANCSHWIEFTTADGLHSRETAINSHPSAWRSRDGHLWFATPKGLEEVDPGHFAVNTVPPPVTLERFAVDDLPQPLHGDDSLRIPAGHNHFQFEYAGLSFVAPQKVRYRFMLQGFDHSWTEAGARRTAYYTNIPPGHYTFQVQAANNDGLWNMQGAQLKFELQPHFYQTVWFYILLALALGGLVVLLLRLRLLRAEREFSAVLGERNRIAREIHDTLAQGYVGISVQLEVLSELLRHNKVEAAAKHLDTTRGYVREGLADARQSIWSLRSQDANENTLPVRMRRVVEQADGHGMEGKFSIYGAYRPMSPGTEREILRVAQEAIHNVKKHADARSLMVQLEYGPAEIALEVRDDGRGFVVETSRGAGPESPAGHYGLTGMRERAAAIGGALEIFSQPGAGTTVRLRAPAPKGIRE
jgi:signal transduction histidine kinase